MQKIVNTFLTLSLLILLSCQTTLSRHVASQEHASQSVEQFVNWETRANGVSTRSNQMIRLEHYEIPLRLLEKDFDETLDQNIKESLIFEKNGEKYVRWMINPEDTKWHLEVKKFLIKNKIDSEPKKFFDAYLTASRSMILVNPENGASFSLKVSTNKTGGNWTDKKQTWEDAVQVRDLDKWMSDVTAKMKTDHLVIMNEPLAMGIKEIDHGMIMRSLNDVPKDEHYYLPGFSALHESEGKRIALLNGATNIAEFWDKNYNQPLAKALAEFFAYTGAWYDSPHSQNFLIEFDKDMKPTGRIVLRDLGDSYLLREFAANTKYAGILKNWEADNILDGRVFSAVGLLHGNTPPSWLSQNDYEVYAKNFFATFEKEFSKLSAIPEKELSSTPLNVRPFSYASKSYSAVSDNWKKFLKYANCFSGEPTTVTGLDCPEFFKKRQRKIDCAGSVSEILLGH